MRIYLQEHFAGTKSSKPARNAIVDMMTTNAWTSAAIPDRCPNWIRSKTTRPKVAIGNTERNAGTCERNSMILL